MRGMPSYEQKDWNDMYKNPECGSKTKKAILVIDTMSTAIYKKETASARWTTC